MTFLVERLAELQKYLQHAEQIRGRGVAPVELEKDLTLRNDVLFTLLTIAQLVIDIAGELTARRGERFESYREAIRKLAGDPLFSGELTARLERLAGFRNIVVHEYVGVDYSKVIEALSEIEPIAEFIAVVRRIES